MFSSMMFGRIVCEIILTGFLVDRELYSGCDLLTNKIACWSLWNVFVYYVVPFLAVEDSLGSAAVLIGCEWGSCGLRVTDGPSQWVLCRSEKWLQKLRGRDGEASAEVLHILYSSVPVHRDRWRLTPCRKHSSALFTKLSLCFGQKTAGWFFTSFLPDLCLVPLPRPPPQPTRVIYKLPSRGNLLQIDGYT